MNATITTPEARRTTLYYREGSSDKVYLAAIEPQDNGFLVTFAFGRRGSTLTTGSKTPRPVDLNTHTHTTSRSGNGSRSVPLTNKPRPLASLHASHALRGCGWPLEFQLGREPSGGRMLG